MNHDETIGEIFISPNNIMKVTYTLYAVEISDVHSEIYVIQHDNNGIDSEISVKVDRSDDLDSIIDIKYRDNSDIYAVIQPMGNDSIDAVIEVSPQNRIWAMYEVQEPPKITEILNPIQDSFTREKLEYQTINYGKNNSLVVGKDNEDYFRTYVQFDLESWNPSYIILDAKIRLYYSGVVPDDMELELFDLSKDWYELGITHLNRPAPTTLIVDKYTKNSQDSYIEFTVTQTAFQWITNSNSNKGFLVRPKNELLSQLITFKSRESSNPPQLRIVYYDNKIYSSGRSQVYGEIFVWNTRDSDVSSEITVSSVIGNSDILSQVYIHRYEVPVENDIYAEIVVSKPVVEGEIIVYRSDESNVDGVLYVRSEIKSNKLDSEITISKPKTEGEIFIKYRDDRESEITIVRDEESVLLSEISVTRPAIDGELFVKYRDDIYAEITIKTLEDNDINSEITVSKPDIWAEIKVVISDENDIGSELYVKHRNDVNSEIYIRVEDDNNLESEIYIKHRNSINSEMAIRAIDVNDLDSEIYVNHVDDVPSEISVSRRRVLCEITVKKSNNIDSEIYIKYRDDINSEITVHEHSNILAVIDIIAVDVIEAEITVSKPDIHAEIMIPYWDDRDVNSEIVARVLRVSNINSEITINKKAKGYVFII